MTFTSGVWCPFSTAFTCFQTGKWVLRFANLKNCNLLVLISLLMLCDTIYSFLLLLFLYSFFSSCFHLCKKKSSRFVSGQCSVEPWSCHELAFAPPPHPFFFSMISHVVIFRDFWTKKFLNICFSVTEFGIKKSKQKLPSSIF